MTDYKEIFDFAAEKETTLTDVKIIITARKTLIIFEHFFIIIPPYIFFVLEYLIQF